MPKAAKKSKLSARYNPVARGDGSSSMETDGAKPAGAAPRLNAHQERHVERKRLQADVAALRSATGKVSKGNKIQHKKDKKALQRELKQTKKAAKELGKRPKAATGGPDSAEDATGMEEEEGCSAPDMGSFVFNLPPAVPGRRR